MDETEKSNLVGAKPPGNAGDDDVSDDDDQLLAM